MIVLFDLDDTLFVDLKKFDTEKELVFPFNLIFKERLRLGTIELLSKIKGDNIQLWIYTTSFRSEKYIKSLFRRYGIKLDVIINGERHQREVQGNKRETMPSRYRIDLHIDDDISVLKNGETYGFKVFLIDDNKPNWAKDIWNQIEKVKKDN